MDREKIITIIIGLLVGILLATAYFAGAKLLPQLKSQPQTIITTNPTAQKLFVDLDRPDDHISTTSGTIDVIGKTLPNSKLVIFGNNDQQVATSSASGTFSFAIKLEEGENEISVTAFDLQGNLSTIKRNVTLEVSP